MEYENVEQIFAQLELDETFNDEISLNRIVGNKTAVEIAKSYVNSYLNDMADGKNPQLKPILLVYEKGSGVHAFARSISNSFGCQLCTISGSWLADRVIGFNGFFLDCDQPFSSFYIHGDKFPSYCQQQLHSALYTKKLPYFDFLEGKWTKKPFSNKLVILSTENKDSLSSLLLKQFPIKVTLKTLSIPEIEAAIKQRLALLNLKISSDLYSKIAHTCGEIGLSMEVLSLSRQIMTSRNEDVLNEGHLNVALHLLDKNMKAEVQKPVG